MVRISCNSPVSADKTLLSQIFVSCMSSSVLAPWVLSARLHFLESRSLLLSQHLFRLFCVELM
jgi:hypothetical protein